MTAGQNTAQLKGSSLNNGLVATVLTVAVVGLVLAAAGMAMRAGSVGAPASTTTIDAARIQFMADEHAVGVTVAKVLHRAHPAHIVPVPASIAALDAARIQFMADEHAASVPALASDTFDAARIQFIAGEHDLSLPAPASDTTIDAARVQFLADERAVTP